MERMETKIDRELLEALRRKAAEEGREEYEILEEAARFYLEQGNRASITELIVRARERRERAGIPEPSEDEAMRIAVAEQHAHRSEARGSGG
ncbi:MAG: hypothetical protein H0U55_06135 [Rubrobacteraceae bacterium]|nr:hypothetical protein [Rubrobacteraceae bacterium]